MEVFKSISANDTQKIAKDVIRKILAENKTKLDNVILLNGNLGSGKTTFVKGVLEYFGITSDRNISPTFVIVKRYSTKNNNEIIKNIYHIDAYRIGKKDNLKNIGIKDMLEDGKGLIFIEWPENILPLLTMANSHNIYFKYCDNRNEREIILK